MTDYTPKNLSEEQVKDLLGMNIKDEFNKISKDLDKFHAIFYQIWEMGYPRLSFEVPTAAVAFDKKGKTIDFIFNPIFWKESDIYTKEFVICHECLHVILNHGIRIKDLKGNIFWQNIANMALDVVVNHMLIDQFNFDRISIKNQENYCWIDTVFGKDYDKVEKNKSFEYYFGLLKDNIKESACSGKMRIKNLDGTMSDINSQTIDIHDFIDGFDDESIKNTIKERINKSMNEFDKKDFHDKIKNTGEGKESIKSNEQEAGNIAAGIKFITNIYEKVNKKRKWETVIKKWSLKYLKSEQDVEQWAKTNRRINGLETNLLLPSDIEDHNISNERINVWFFLDTSGSCIHLKDRFFRAARSLPQDKFIIRLYSFDTEVYDVDIEKGEVYGGGGTSFYIIENRIQRDIKKYNTKYPEAVFIITDGYGDTVVPQFPKKWYWFLTTKCKSYIPKDSNTYMLSNYE